MSSPLISRRAISPPFATLLLVIGGWIAIRILFTVIGHEPTRRVSTLLSHDLTRDPQKAIFHAFDRPSLKAVDEGRMPRVELSAPMALKPAVAAAMINLPEQIENRSLPGHRINRSDQTVGPELQSTMWAALRKQDQPLASTFRRNWYFYGWLFYRRDTSTVMPRTGFLGASQAGARLTYRFAGEEARPLAVSLRLATSIDKPRAAEAGLGIEWKPLKPVPFRILVERRQKLGDNGRSAFSVLVHGGVSEVELPFDLRAGAYGQAGIVGFRSRDMFADFSTDISFPLNSAPDAGVKIGLWGSVQPELSRLDAGPGLWVRFPKTNVEISAEWRMRIVGNARPASGPALTVSTAF